VIEFLLLGGLPLSVWAMERLRRRQIRQAHASFLATLDDDLQVVLHVANHEARQRDHSLQPLHLVYGLLQDEPFRDVIAKVGGDPARIEETVTSALDGVQEATNREALEALGFISAVAQHLERKATVGDLFARLARNVTVAKSFEASELPVHELLFAVVHGTKPPALMLPAPSPGAVHVVLRNDDVTTVEFVMSILREVFELDPARAQTVTMETHHQGRAIVGRFSPEIAATHIESVRTRARAAGFPLWVGVEPC
jgi:ATP-dependent Clp protease adaptor protein ClpS